MKTKTMKNPFKNLRGVELSLQTIIVIVLLLIVLTVLMNFFLGGMSTTLPKLALYGNETVEAIPSHPPTW